MEAENIRVYLRIRPFIEREDKSTLNPAINRRTPSVVQILDPEHEGADMSSSASVRLLNSRAMATMDSEMFTFDSVGSLDVEQEKVFEATAKAMTDNCLLGYNGTIFA